MSWLSGALDTVNNAISSFGGVATSVNEVVGNVQSIFSSGSGSSPKLPSGTISIPTGNGPIVVQSQPPAPIVDTSNPWVVGIGALIVLKLLKVI